MSLSQVTSPREITKTLRTRLIDYNDDYIGIEISITINTRYYNIIFITIHLFDDNTITES